MSAVSDTALSYRPVGMYWQSLILSFKLSVSACMSAVSDTALLATRPCRHLQGPGGMYVGISIRLSYKPRHYVGVSDTVLLAKALRLCRLSDTVLLSYKALTAYVGTL
ncbi:hypothetical protein J6590_080006 [Homalodisca vitripennis]|nr:hypothetical protein J6590_080006 [Homalodisca vitripennis]